MALLGSNDSPLLQTDRHRERKRDETDRQTDRQTRQTVAHSIDSPVTPATKHNLCR